MGLDRPIKGLPGRPKAHLGCSGEGGRWAWMLGDRCVQEGQSITCCATHLSDVIHYNGVKGARKGNEWGQNGLDKGAR